MDTPLGHYAKEPPETLSNPLQYKNFEKLLGRSKARASENDQFWNQKNAHYYWNDAYGWIFGGALISIYVSSAVTSYQLNL